MLARSWSGMTSSGTIDADAFGMLYGTVAVSGPFRANRLDVSAILVLTGPVSDLGEVYDYGLLDLTGATLAPAAKTLDSLTLAGGTLVADDDLTVTGTFTWAGGTLRGAGGSGSLTAAGGTYARLYEMQARRYR